MSIFKDHHHLFQKNSDNLLTSAVRYSLNRKTKQLKQQILCLSNLGLHGAIEMLYYYY